MMNIYIGLVVFALATVVLYKLKSAPYGDLRDGNLIGTPIGYLDDFFGKYRQFLPLTKKNKLAVFAYICWKWRVDKFDMISLVGYLFFCVFTIFVSVYIDYYSDSKSLRAVKCMAQIVFLASIFLFVGKIVWAHWTFGREVRRKRKERAGLGLDTSDEAVFEELASKSEFGKFVEKEIRDDEKRDEKGKYRSNLNKLFRFCYLVILGLIFAFLPIILFLSGNINRQSKRERDCKTKGIRCNKPKQNFLNNTNATSEPQN